MIYRLESVTKIYLQGHARVRALGGVTLGVTPGEHVALLGQSGAGKSTLFRLLNATIRPTSGRIAFEGRDMNSLSGADVRAMRRRIGTIYQQHNLVPSLTALENTLCGALGRWSLARTLRTMVRPRHDDFQQALEALERVGLADQRDARADELSGGQQQRVAIARVLMQDPEVILADEPVASLDPGLADDIIALLTRIALDGKRTLIVALHAVGLALQHFPRAVALRGGSVEFDTASADVTSDQVKKLYDTNAAPSSPGPHGRGFKLECDCAG